MRARWLVWTAVVGLWLVAVGLEAWLGAHLASSEVVAGLISPQGVTLAGLLEVAAFVGARLLAVLILPSVVAATVVGTLPRLGGRRPGAPSSRRAR